MQLNDYQEDASKTAIYPQVTDSIALTYLALGLNGEAGEVAEHIKKMIRDDGGTLTFERKQALKKEIGDVLWYVSELARRSGIYLEEIAQENLNKLSKRQSENKLNGSGSDR